MNAAPICSTRAPPPLEMVPVVLVTCPNDDELMFWSAITNVGWLNTLNASPRNCKDMDSWIGIAFRIDRSVSKNIGPLNSFLERLPIWPGCGLQKPFAATGEQVRPSGPAPRPFPPMKLGSIKSGPTLVVGNDKWMALLSCEALRLVKAVSSADRLELERFTVPRAEKNEKGAPLCKIQTEETLHPPIAPFTMALLDDSHCPLPNGKP